MIIVPGIYRTCEETTGMLGETYLRCGRPAAALVQHQGRKEEPYFMCDACANHNVRNRNAVALLSTAEAQEFVSART